MHDPGLVTIVPSTPNLCKLSVGTPPSIFSMQIVHFKKGFELVLSNFMAESIWSEP